MHLIGTMCTFGGEEVSLVSLAQAILGATKSYKKGTALATKRATGAGGAQ
jgi:hypothetical protein